MALEYDLDLQVKELTQISSEYLEWFMAATHTLFYPQNPAAKQDIPVPNSFESWLAQVQNKNILDGQALEIVGRRHMELLSLANQILITSEQTAQPPSFETYDLLTKSFKGFMDKIQRIEKDMIAGSSNFDLLTGLRSPIAMKADLEKEMQRFIRQGKPFAVALAKINFFDSIQNRVGEENANEHVKDVAGLIKRSVRPFDDAYYIGDSEFILCLKQSDTAGGIKALERLKELLEQDEIVTETEKQGRIKLSLSCCVTEPIEGENFDTLIENLRKDLESIKQDEDSVLQYYEMSPLERFVQSQS